MTDVQIYIKTSCETCLLISELLVELFPSVVGTQSAARGVEIGHEITKPSQTHRCVADAACSQRLRCRCVRVSVDSWPEDVSLTFP